MTPDEHARYAEGLLESDRREGGRSSVRTVVLLRAIVHAILSLREPKPARKKPGPKPKKTTTSKEEA